MWPGGLEPSSKQWLHFLFTLSTAALKNSAAPVFKPDQTRPDQTSVALRPGRQEVGGEMRRAMEGNFHDI